MTIVNKTARYTGKNYPDAKGHIAYEFWEDQEKVVLRSYVRDIDNSAQEFNLDERVTGETKKIFKYNPDLLEAVYGPGKNHPQFTPLWKTLTGSTFDGDLDFDSEKLIFEIQHWNPQQNPNGLECYGVATGDVEIT